MYCTISLEILCLSLKCSLLKVIIFNTSLHLPTPAWKLKWIVASVAGGFPTLWQGLDFIHYGEWLLARRLKSEYPNYTPRDSWNQIFFFWRLSYNCYLGMPVKVKSFTWNHFLEFSCLHRKISNLISYSMPLYVWRSLSWAQATT